MKLRTLSLILTWLLAATAHAQYMGLEPGRLVNLMGPEGDAASEDWAAAEAVFRSLAETDSGDRLRWAVSLFQLGKKEEALDAARSRADTWELRYASVLLRLHADRDVSFRQIRSELVDLGLETPDTEELFDLWLALNPTDEELEAHLARLAGREEPEIRWRRSEVYLRLDKAEEARAELRGAAFAAEPPALRNRIDLAHARALFQLRSDGAGQTLYEGILDRLDPPTAGRLYRDFAAIATRAEREDYWTRDLDGKKEFLRLFWQRRHPVPTQKENPRLAEHYRRLARALRDYPLQSTGRGYFTDEEVFLELSPRLPYYDSTVLFRESQAARYWVDHRGLMVIRHGLPDRRIPERSYSGSDKTASWLVSPFQGQPMAFHFVEPPRVGEWILALNLGVAATRPTAADDPRQVVSSRTNAFGPLYFSRSTFLPLYQQILNAQSVGDLERGLVAESSQMAAFAQAALSQDTTAYYTQANTLPMVVSVSNFYSEGQPAIQVDFAADLEVLEEEQDKLGPDSELVATVIAYDREWKEVLRREERRFPLGTLPEGDSKIYLGNVQIYDLDPQELRLIVELRQPDTGRLGLARGRHVPTYLPPEHLGLSDLFLQARGSREEPWQAVPSRIVRRKRPVRLDFELYNLQGLHGLHGPSEGGSGLARYEIEERVLTLYKEPGFLSQLATVGSQVAGGFFPLYTLAANAGGFFVSQSLVNDHAGLTVSKRVVEKPADSRVTESLEMDLSRLDKGIHTIYVTVRDLNTGEITSRFLTIRVS